MAPRTVSIKQCPVCTSLVLHTHYMQDADSKAQSVWYHCSCGVVFNAEPAPYEPHDINRYKDGGKKYEDSCRFPAHVYAPIIEESVYGRKMLEVGHQHPYLLQALGERGWITMSMDKNPAYEDSETHLVEDIEETDPDEDFKVSLVWMDQTLEKLRKPKETLRKIFDLLTEDGILFLATADVDFINTRSPSKFNHWKPQNYIMWNRRSLTAFLEQLGFSVIVCRKNQEHRFNGGDTLHIIAQKKFF